MKGKSVILLIFALVYFSFHHISAMEVVMDETSGVTSNMETKSLSTVKSIDSQLVPILNTTWYTYETDNMIFYMTEEVKENHPHIYEDAEAIQDELRDFFQYDLDNKVEVYLHYGEKIFKFHSQANYSTDPNDDMESDYVIINVKTLSREGNHDVRYHLAHELGHAFTNHRWNLETLNTLTWLTEGIAEYAAKQKVEYPERKEFHLKPLYYGKEMYVTELHAKVKGREGWEPRDYSYIEKLVDIDSVGDYFIFESVYYFIESVYGEEKIFEFIDTYSSKNKETYDLHLDKTRELKAFENNNRSTIEEVFGISEEAFVQEWKQFYEIN